MSRMKGNLVLFFIFFAFKAIAQNPTATSTRDQEIATNIHKAHFFIYTSPIGIEHVDNATPFLSWIASQENQNFSTQGKFMRVTLLTVDYFPHNRMFIGASFLDRALGLGIQGGPNFGLTPNFHFGVRVLRKKVMLDLLCGFENTEWKFRFDSPPPFYQNDANIFLNENSFNAKDAVHFELLNKQICLEPAIRFAYQFKDKQVLGIKIGYRYVFEDGAWNFYAAQPKGGLLPKYYDVSSKTPDELNQTLLTNGFYFQLIWGINFTSPATKHFDWEKGERVPNN